MNLESTSDAAREARLAIRHELSDSLPAPVLYDLMLAVTELVENSVRHGPGDEIEVRIRARDGFVRGEVAERVEPRPVVAAVSDNFQGGLGLRIIDAVADRWGVEDNYVWFELPVV